MQAWSFAQRGLASNSFPENRLPEQLTHFQCTAQRGSVHWVGKVSAQLSVWEIIN